MVIDQGSMLDRIDYNVERMAVDVKEADKELKVASGYQRRTVKRKIMLLLIILIVGAVILLSLKLGTRSGGGGERKPVKDIPPGSVEEAHAIDDMLDGGMGLLERSREIAGFRQRKDWQRRKRRLWGGIEPDFVERK